MTANQLYVRYMAAFEAWTAHSAECGCVPEAPCAKEGEALFERFSRLQAAWNNHLARRR